MTKYLSFFFCCCFYCQIIFFLGLSRYLGLCFYWCGDHVAYTGMGSQCVYSCVYIVSENFCLLGNVGNLWWLALPMPLPIVPACSSESLAEHPSCPSHCLAGLWRSSFPTPDFFPIFHPGYFLLIIPLFCKSSCWTHLVNFITLGPNAQSYSFQL